MSWEQYEAFCAAKNGGEVGWNHASFDAIREKMREEKAFINNPITIEEGVMECKQCKSSKTYSHQKQTRSADEGFSTFISCFNCKYSWREN